jgi:hypothetical protein
MKRLGWWLIGRLVWNAVPVDGMLWVDPKEQTDDPTRLS